MSLSVLGLKSHDGPRTPNGVFPVISTRASYARRMRSLDVLRQLARPLVDPAVHADLVAIVDHATLLVGVQQGDHAGDEERGGNAMALEHLEDARHRHPRAVLSLREPPG